MYRNTATAGAMAVVVEAGRECEIESRTCDARSAGASPPLPFIGLGRPLRQGVVRGVDLFEADHHRIRAAKGLHAHELGWVGSG